MSIFFHEELYRSKPVMEKLRDFPVTVCGAGALGANLTESLARSGFGSLKVIDRDRIEERNLSTQPYQRADIGAHKATILANSLYRAVGVQVEAVARELEERNVARLLKGSGLVVDTFDNSRSRELVTRHCREAGLECLHAGLAGDYAEVVWNEVYRVPGDAHDDICDYPLARNLAMMAASLAAEIMVGFLATGDKRSLSLTLVDFAVREY